MTGVRGLFREAGRAAAFMRRLERSLEPARRAVSASADWTILSVDARLAGLTDPVDVSSALDAAMSRLAATPLGDQQETRTAGRVETVARASDGRRRQSMPDEVSPPRRLAARSRPTAASHAAAVLRKASTTIVPSGHASVAAVSARATAQGAFAASHAADPMALAPSTIQTSRPGASRPSPLSLRASAGVVSPSAEDSNGTLTPAAVNRIPHVRPSQATAILSERMRATNTLDAFRSVVQAVPSTRADRERPALSAALGRSFAAEPIATVVPPVVRVSGVAPLPQPAAAGAPSVSGRIEDAAHAGLRRAPAPMAGSTLSGLRRLAALATTSLDDPRPAVEPVRPSPPVAGVEEELDRILRAEALRYGIGVDGVVR